MLRAILRFLIPLRSIASELSMIRKLYALELSHVHGIVLPDEKLLKNAGKDNEIEILYGVREPKPEDWNSDDGINVQ